jgi:hypothetical protein
MCRVTGEGLFVGGYRLKFDMKSSFPGDTGAKSDEAKARMRF